MSTISATHSGTINSYGKRSLEKTKKKPAESLDSSTTSGVSNLRLIRKIYSFNKRLNDVYLLLLQMQQKPSSSTYTGISLNTVLDKVIELKSGINPAEEKISSSYQRKTLLSKIFTADLTLYLEQLKTTHKLLTTFNEENSKSLTASKSFRVITQGENNNSFCWLEKFIQEYLTDQETSHKKTKTVQIATETDTLSDGKASNTEIKCPIAIKQTAPSLQFAMEIPSPKHAKTSSTSAFKLFIRKPN